MSFMKRESEIARILTHRKALIPVLSRHQSRPVKATVLRSFLRDTQIGLGGVRLQQKHLV